MYIESLLQKKSVNFICKFFSCIKSKFSASYSFFSISNVKCVKSASQKDITDAMSFHLHVDIDRKDFYLLAINRNYYH